MTAADDHDPLAGISLPLLTQHIRDPVIDAAARPGLSDGGQAIGAQRIGRAPGSGRVDHGPRPNSLQPLDRAHQQFEGTLIASPIYFIAKG